MRLISSLGTTLALVAFAHPTLAFECPEPDPARSFIAARDSTDRYLILRGHFTADPAEPVRAQRVEGGMAYGHIHSWTGRFKGVVLAEDGFTRPIDASLTYRHICRTDSFCDSATPDFPMIAFVQDTAEGLTFSNDKCGLWIIANPTPAHSATIETCARGGACDPAR